MNNINNSNVEALLCDVRKAYRLLHIYQKRVLDLVNFISNYWGFKLNSGNPWFSNASFQRSSVKLNQWPWDWLPMYCYNFYFNREGDIPLWLGIIIQSDTGYYDNMNVDINSPLEFPSPKDSDTRIILLINDKPWLEREDGAFSKNKIEYEGDDCYGKAYPLSLFSNEKSAKEQMEDFVLYCSTKGIEIDVNNIEKQ